MLYAIGGVPRTGKSKLAARVHADSGYSVLTTDAIIELLMKVAPELHVDYSHRDRRRKIAPGLIATVKQIMKLNEHFIVEGELLDPWLISQLQTVTDTRACFLSMSNPDLRTIIGNEGSNAWVAGLNEVQSERLLADLVKFNEELVSGSSGFDGENTGLYVRALLRIWP